MDIFKFRNPTAPTLMEQGEIIDNVKSKMWVERYVDAGEFEIIASISTGIREKLPIGTFISHVDSREIMIVENHEIREEKGKEIDIKITGRGFETLFENRILGSNNNVWPQLINGVGHKQLTGYPADQIVLLIKNHIDPFYLFDDNDAIPYTTVITDVPQTGPLSDEITFERQSLYEAVINLLKSRNMGIQIIRPGTWNASSPNIQILIHEGNDLTESVLFSEATGEIESSDYLWTNKNLKNAALITGQWIGARVLPVETEIERRWMYIDAKDIDSNYDTWPSLPADQAAIMLALERRGREILAAQKEIALIKTEVSKDITSRGYRYDYTMGDIITVSGSYGEIKPMRVNEYVEIEDENGEKSYPTLTELL